MILKKNLSQEEIKAVMLGWQKWMEIAHRLEAGDEVICISISQALLWKSDLSIIPDDAKNCELCKMVADLNGRLKCWECPYCKNYGYRCYRRGQYWYEWTVNPCYQTAYELAERFIRIIFPY